MRAGKPFNPLNDKVDHIEVMGPPISSLTRDEWNNIRQKCRDATKGTPYNDIPRKLPAQPMATLPRWLLMIALFGCIFCGFILGAVLL